MAVSGITRAENRLTAVRAFAATENAGAVVLLAATIAALVWANSPWSATYTELWDTEFGLSFWIVLPLAGPGIVTAFIFGFTNSWNEFLFAVVMAQRTELRTIPAGLYSFQVGDVLLWGQLMAAALIATQIDPSQPVDARNGTPSTAVVSVFGSGGAK